MTFAAVGTFTNVTTSTPSLAPVSIGDLLICWVISHDGTIWATGITGSNITWTQAGVKFLGTTTAFYCTVFLGTATATGSAVNTIAFSGTAPAISGLLLEFSSTAGSWFLDGSQGNLDAVTATCPSLTPAGGGDLYACFAREAGSSANGVTAGYTFGADGAANGYCFNPACTSAVQAPAFGNSDTRVGIAVLIRETGQATTTATGAFYPTAFGITAGGTGFWVNPANAEGPAGSLGPRSAVPGIARPGLSAIGSPGIVGSATWKAP